MFMVRFAHVYGSLRSRKWLALLTKVVHYVHVRFSHFRTGGAINASLLAISR